MNYKILSVDTAKKVVECDKLQNEIIELKELLEEKEYEIKELKEEIERIKKSDEIDPYWFYGVSENDFH